MQSRGAQEIQFREKKRLKYGSLVAGSLYNLLWPLLENVYRTQLQNTVTEYS